MTQIIHAPRKFYTVSYLCPINKEYIPYPVSTDHIFSETIYVKLASSLLYGLWIYDSDMKRVLVNPTHVIVERHIALDKGKITSFVVDRVITLTRVAGDVVHKSLRKV